MSPWISWPLTRLKRLRDWYLVHIRWRHHRISRGFHAGRGVVIWARAPVEIGENCYIGRQSQIECDAKIGNHVIMANRVALVGRYDHHFQQIGTPIRSARQIRDRNYHWKGANLRVVVEDDVWIGYGAILLSGVTLGEGCIVATGSVVTKDVAPYVIVGGNPARVLARRFEDEDSERIHRAAINARRQNLNNPRLRHVEPPSIDS